MNEEELLQYQFLEYMGEVNGVEQGKEEKREKEKKGGNNANKEEEEKDEMPPEKPEIHCAICLMEHEEDEGIYLNCGHFFCREGMESYVQTCVDTNEVVKCPANGCNTLIMAYEVESCVCKGLFEKLDKLNLNKALNVNVITCPTPDCKNCFFIDETWSGRREIVCESCFCFFCSDCRENYHYDTLCQDYKLKQAIWKDELEIIKMRVNNAGVKSVNGKNNQGVNVGNNAGVGGNQGNNVDAKDKGKEKEKETISSKEQYLKDEIWKEEHCRHCPFCNHIIERVDGCENMRCGSDNPYSKGGLTQNGCGLPFCWDNAKPYQSNKAQNTTNEKRMELAQKYNKLRVIDLKGLLKEKNLPKMGTKRVLIERLIVHDVNIQHRTEKPREQPKCAVCANPSHYQCLNCNDLHHLCKKCIPEQLETAHKNHVFDIL